MATTTDVSCNLKARNNNGEVAYRLLPKTLANNVVESSEKRFVAQYQIDAWNAKMDKIDNIPDEDILKMFEDDI